jgi:aryl sulfotransferase
MVHYADMKRDLEGEMRRVADFLDIAVSEQLWPELVGAASFETMRQQGDQLMPTVTALFREGRERFFHKGENERWKGTYRNEDLALYEAKVVALLSPECATWLERGRQGTTTNLGQRA